jgi:hypothetical protein
MTTFISVYHSGVVITNEIDSYEFVGMKNETFLLNEFLTHANVVRLVRERLGWMDESCKVGFEGLIEEGQIIKIVIFFTLTLVREVCKTNKQFCMSLVGSFDPPS